MKLFKLIAITLSIMLSMSLSACESKPTMHVSDETEAVATVVDVVSVPETTTVEITTASETTTTEEPKKTRCDCERCSKVFENRGIEHPLGNRDGKLGYFSAKGDCEELDLVEMAIQIIVDLDSDYETAIKQLRFEPGPNDYRAHYYEENSISYLEWCFGKNKNWGLKGIDLAYGPLLPPETPPFASVTVYAWIGGEDESRDRTDSIGVEFIEVDGEWYVNNLFRKQPS